MSYLKKEYRDLLKKMDKELKLPKDWSRFVKKEAEKDNFLIKTKGICTCGNCKYEFKSNKKINELEKCPKCKKVYLIKRSNFKWHVFNPRTLVLLDRLNENWVIRLFEIQSRYADGEIRHSKAAEYGRIIPFKNLHFVNNRVCCGIWGSESVNVYAKITKWRQYHSGYRRLYAGGKLYHGNLKKLFKNTEYEYSQVWTLAKREDDIDIIYYLKNNLQSTEMLIKLGFYKLALCPQTFNKKGCFEKRFGVDKSFYSFMKKYNLDIDELQVLKLYKKRNIENVRYLKQFRQEHLTKIAKYMCLDKFVDFVKKEKKFDINMYYDYLGFLEELELDIKNKIYLFPVNVKEEHDKYEKQVKIKRDEITKKNIEKRYIELEKNKFSDNKYFIVPAKSLNELEDESKQQVNCVRTYAERYSKGNCDIYFMREKKTPEKSLVTVEVKNNKVVQSKIKYNKDVNRSQKNFLGKWENQILNAA